MKKRILFLLLLMIYSMIHSKAQLSSAPIWKELKVGDTMPDITLGTVVNNVTGKERFSDFKGKLIILDFWNSGCGSCIAAWPHMSALQEQYKDKIQIFLVNHEETQKEIEQQLARFYKNKKIVYPANLPSIVSSEHGDNILNTFFPPKGETGYHVWIAGNGVIRLRGNGRVNTYEEKIEDLLAGKPISYVSDQGVAKSRRANPTPLFLDITEQNQSIVKYHSMITQFSDEIAAHSGAEQKDHIDTVSGTKRNSYWNYEVMELYIEAVATPIVRSNWHYILSGALSVMHIQVKDKSKYSSDYLTRPKTDEWLRANTFSYEQIVPSNLDDTTRHRYMLEDLNRYFGHLYGTKGKLEKRKISCWQIIRTLDNNKLPVASDAGKQSIKELNEKGKAVREYRNIELQDILRNIIIRNKSLTEHNRLPFIDATQFEGRVDLRVPKEITTIEALQAALKPYGLDVVKGEKELSVLVIQEKGVEE